MEDVHVLAAFGEHLVVRIQERVHVVAMPEAPLPGWEIWYAARLRTLVDKTFVGSPVGETEQGMPIWALSQSPEQLLPVTLPMVRDGQATPRLEISPSTWKAYQSGLSEATKQKFGYWTEVRSEGLMAEQVVAKAAPTWTLNALAIMVVVGVFITVSIHMYRQRLTESMDESVSEDTAPAPGSTAPAGVVRRMTRATSRGVRQYVRWWNPYYQPHRK